MTLRYIYNCKHDKIHTHKLMDTASDGHADLEVLIF